MEAEKFRDLLDRYARGKCSAEEEKFVDEFYNNLDSLHTHEFIVPSDFENAIWKKIKPGGKEHKKYSIAWRVAASFAFFLMIGAGIFALLNEQSRIPLYTRDSQGNSFTMSKDVIVHNSKNIPVDYTFPDGSIVTLKPNSIIKFDKGFSSGKREVLLTGEAFFKVTHDPSRPFMVYANELVTKVLGTSFNVKAYPADNQITVAVKTGKVSVYSKQQKNSLTAPNNNQVILTPNQKAVYDRESDRVSKQLVEKPEIILPQSSLFRMKYDSTPVTTILEAIEENYGIDIIFNEEILRSCMVTTSMSEEGLYERIDVICKAINAAYSVENASIIINSRGCD